MGRTENSILTFSFSFFLFLNNTDIVYVLEKTELYEFITNYAIFFRV